MEHKSGFVNIIGNPNVGKSTLMNALVGEKISIITSKSQTTRHRILGIVNGDDFQVVFSDTPGVLKPSSKLQQAMLNYSNSAFEDADVLLYVTDIYETFDKNADYLSKVKLAKVPVLLLLNKIDLSYSEKVNELIENWKQQLPNAEIFAMSALKDFNIENIFNRVLEILPKGPAYYPKDQLTDKTERFFVEEIVREKILLHYKKEIPYSVEILVEEFVETKEIIKIRTIIFVERDSQKGIIIGHKGEALKRVGTEARKDIESFFDKKVFIEIYVKVNKDWRNKENTLKRFGYNL